jgi:hypothetical protein
MDSIRKIRIDPPKAKTEETEIPQKQNPMVRGFFQMPIRYQFGILLSLLSLLTWSFPHSAFAAANYGSLSGPMIFMVGERPIYIDYLNLQLNQLYNHQKMQAEIDRQLELEQKLHDYLAAQGSPLADYTSTLVQVPNWKKIIALSNAESGLCRHYPTNKSNCWGVGGPDLWYMGSNLSQGILSMNNFLENYPNNSQVKYAQMTFKQMNGLYKQPARQHWVDNNQSTYDDLTAIENSL